MGNELIYSLTVLRFRKCLFIVTCQLDLVRKKNKYINNYRLGTIDDQITFQLLFFQYIQLFICKYFIPIHY